MSNFSIKRNENGQVQINMNNIKNKEIDGVGKLTGSATFSVGNTGQASNETVVQLGQTKDDDALLVIADDELDNIEFYGTDLYARFDSKTDKDYNIQWDAKNSVLDSSKSGGSMLVTTNEKSENNTFVLGSTDNKQQLFADSNVDNMIVDKGNNNTFVSAANSANYFETTETSVGAKIYGGDGDNTFLVNGSKGFVVGGRGNDLFITGNKSENNMLFGMDGNDMLTDYGNHNFFGGGRGVDSIETHGRNGLAHLGNNENYNAVIGDGSRNNAIFSTQVQEDSQGNEYFYQDYIDKYLEDNGMTLEEFKRNAGLLGVSSLAEIYNSMVGM